MSGANLETLSPAVPDSLDRLSVAILRRVCEAELKLATAESCTGGLLASTLTDVTGCSHAFERGFVAYTDAAKVELLKVSPDLIARHGAVSREVAIAMAEGGLQNSSADVCMAVTGYADDGGGQVQAGLVHFALASKRRSTIHSRKEFGDLGRGPVRVECLRTALGMLEDYLSKAEARS